MQWSRGCGNGIGLSDHRNAYHRGALLDNFVEDAAAAAQAASGEHYLGFGQPGDHSTIYRGGYWRTEADFGAAIREGQAQRVEPDVLRKVCLFTSFDCC